MLNKCREYLMIYLQVCSFFNDNLFWNLQKS